MPANPAEVARREKIARAHIDAAYAAPGNEMGVTLFVSHHLKELDASYWKAHVGSGTPEPRQVLEVLELRSHWDSDDDEEEDDGIEMLDFTLPGGVTQYVICVEFDAAGNVARVAMES